MPKKRLTHEFVKSEFEKLGLTLLSQYINSKTKLLFRCWCGNKHSLSWDVFNQNPRGCPECGFKRGARSKNLKYDTLLTHAAKIGVMIVTTKKEYESSQQTTASKIKVKCIKRGHEHLKNKNAIINTNKGCWECYVLEHKKENHPRWKGGLPQKRRNTTKEEIYLCRDWKFIIEEIYDNKCAICGDENNLQAHHLNGWIWDIENRFNPENGVALCKKCHHQFHKKYGVKHSTLKQFEEYELDNRPQYYDFSDWKIN